MKFQRFFNLLMALCLCSIASASSGHLNRGTLEGAPANKASFLLETYKLGVNKSEKRYVESIDAFVNVRTNAVQDLFCCSDADGKLSYCQDKSETRITDEAAAKVHFHFAPFWANKSQNWQICDDGSKAKLAIEKINCEVGEDFFADCAIETWIFTD
jgi:hypothetical protein